MGLTINQQTEDYGRRLSEAVRTNNESDYNRIILNEVTPWLERFRNEGIFLQEGLSITYTTRELLGLIKIAIALEALKDVYIYPWRLINSTLIFIVRLFSEFMVDEGYCVSTGPRWKHPPWEGNINGIDILMQRIYGIKFTKNNPFHRDRLEDINHPHWSIPSHVRHKEIMDLLFSKDFLDIAVRIREHLQDPLQGRIAYPVVWNKHNISLEIYSPTLPLVSDEDSKPGFKGLNLMYYLFIDHNGNIKSIEYHRGVTKKRSRGLPNTRIPINLFQNYLSPDSKPFPVYLFGSDEEDPSIEPIEPIEPIGGGKTLKEKIIRHAQILQRLAKELPE